MTNSSKLLIGLLVFAAIFPFARAEEYSSANYTVLAPTLSPGDSYGASTHYSLVGTLGEPSNGSGDSNSFGIIAGFAPIPFVTTPVVIATGVQNAVNLSWTAVAGASGTVTYTVGQASVPGGPYAFTSAGSALSLSIGNLTGGQAYYFIVRARDATNAVVATSSEVSATPTAQNATPQSSSGGGGGSITYAETPSAAVTISGRAYPLSTVVLLEDGQPVVSTIADPLANFSTSLTVPAGSHLFSVYSQDAAGNRSGTFSFPVTLAAGAHTDIGGIFLSPTISVDKTEVKRGDNLIIFGQSAPKSTIIISVHSDTELFRQTKSDAFGGYLYMLDTSPLEIGSHEVKAKASASGQISDYGRYVAFTVGSRSVKVSKKASCSEDDLACGGSVVIPFALPKPAIPAIPQKNLAAPKSPFVQQSKAPAALKATPSLQKRVQGIQKDISSKRDSLCISPGLPRLGITALPVGARGKASPPPAKPFVPQVSGGLSKTPLPGLSTKTLNLPSIFSSCGDTLGR